MKVLSSGQPTESLTLLDERNLARLLIKRWRFGIGDNFYAVRMIAKDLKVTPDIDLLNVYVNPHHPEENTVIAFELKILKYHRRYKRISMTPFFQGLGQVLTYFQHGIDRATLVMGFHPDTEAHPDETKQAEELLKEYGNYLKTSVFRNFPYLQIAYVKKADLEWVLHQTDWDRARFPYSSDRNRELRRENILQKQLTCEKLD